MRMQNPTGNDRFTIVETAAALRAGATSPLQVLELCLDRIRRFEPQVHAWVTVDEAGARAAAERAGAELRSGIDRGPLHGIPLGIKDIVDVEHLPTRGGSPLLEGNIARSDAVLVAGLRRAGAVILGKTVTTQFACFDPPPTRNPWNLQRTPGGSSSGSAAAVAAGMCLGSVGSQTGGSITRPASFCGISACKPTYGAVALRGVLPLATLMDHPGPMARCVADLAILLRAMAFDDGCDPHRSDRRVDLSAFTASPVRPPRVGLLRTHFVESADGEIRRLTLAAVEHLTRAGATVRDITLPADWADVAWGHRLLIAVGAAEAHRGRFADNRNHYAPAIRQLIEDGTRMNPVDHAHAVRRQAELRAATVAAMGDCDVMLCPSTVTAAPGVDTTGDPKFNAPWSYLGLPTVTIPCGLTADGLPAGLQFVGRPWDESAVLSAAAWAQASDISPRRGSTEPPDGGFSLPLQVRFG